MTGRGARRLAAAAALALLAGGCRGGGEQTPDVGAGVDVDSTNANPHDGMSTDQVERAAVPMSEAEARARGLVDTTIHLENLGPRDTIPAGRPDSLTPSPDTLGSPRAPTVNENVGTTAPPARTP